MNSLKIKISLVFIVIISFVIIVYKFYKYNSPAISVIIPCYNSSAYIKDLFEMLNAQTFKNYEIIFVDDGSTDNTSYLINTQKSNDKRIKLVTLGTNTGAGNARNMGLRYARGDYLIFLDSDDIFYPNLLETGYSLAKEHNVDILLFDFKCQDAEMQDCQYWRDNMWGDVHVAPINKVFSPEEIADSLFTFSHGIVWNKIYKRNFVVKNKLYFLNLPKHNDTFFVYTSYVLAKRMYITDEILLTYRLHNKNSITIAHKNRGRECRNINLHKLKSFLIAKKKFDLYKNALYKLRNDF